MGKRDKRRQTLTFHFAESDDDDLAEQDQVSGPEAAAVAAVAAGAATHWTEGGSSSATTSASSSAFASSDAQQSDRELALNLYRELNGQDFYEEPSGEERIDAGTVDNLTQAYRQDEYVMPGKTVEGFMSQQKLDEDEDGALISPRSAKRQKIPDDTEETVFLVTKKSVTAYTRGDTWTSTDQDMDPRKYYVIESFPRYSGGFSKIAECKVFLELKDTFVGGDCDKDPFVLCPKKERIPLCKLNEPHPDIHPDKDGILTYETSKKSTHGCGWFVTYKMKDKDDIKYEEEVSIDVPVLEIFAGGGGMSEGLKNAGMNVRWAVEMDPNAAHTWEMNHNGACTIMFQENFASWKIKKEAGAKPFDKVIPKHLHGSPPCCPFSMANRTGGKNDQANKDMTDLFFDEASDENETHDTITLENVDNIVKSSKHRNYMQRGALRLIRAGFQVSLRIVNAKDFGDPQSRLRAVLLGARRHLPFFPTLEPTHGAEGSGLLPIVNARAALGDLESIDLASKDNHGAIFNLANGNPVYGYHSEEGTKLKSEMVAVMSQEPTGTVTRSNSLKHFSHERCLTVREEARLQGFPDTYRFCGSSTAQRGIIGNAVPVGLATAVGKAIMKSYRERDYAYVPDAVAFEQALLEKC